jgi:ABC-type transport system involved in cytochrome bd biosynthesis fused ATPase/permease subunit
MPSTPGPTGISPAIKYVALAITTIVGMGLGFLETQPAITAATAVAAVVYVIPTVISELEGA